MRCYDQLEERGGGGRTLSCRGSTKTSAHVIPSPSAVVERAIGAPLYDISLLKSLGRRECRADPSVGRFEGILWASIGVSVANFWCSRGEMIRLVGEWGGGGWD